ncbi:hypothetical protein HGRIS_002784 [Hohenbuehelia grisea]|uniref:Uncharacterized protein n=1 Tax=Hohenbuehelia grisea TaxID=104357 RepID=A0ABR3JLP0_9AGAR
MSSSSIVASILSFSTRSSRSVSQARSGLFSWDAVMDSILAIATGLGLRVVVDAVSHDDLRTTGSIIGLWEGVVLMHFLNKMPRSYDPYVAYIVRLFVDFLVTESLSRLAIVLLWTGMGMVVADVAPIFWYDMGFRRAWRRLRRDTYILLRPIRKAFPYFGRSSSSSSRLGSASSRVRFHERSSPSRHTHAESVATTAVRSNAPSTTTTATRTTTTSIPTQTPGIPPTSQIPPDTLRRRLVPGSFPGYASETETERGSVAGLPPLPPSTKASTSGSVLSDAASDILATPRAGHSRIQLRAIPDDPLQSPGVSSTSSLSDDVSLDLENAELPDIDVLQAESVHVAAAVVKDREHTPRQQPMVLPPTPADTLRSVDVRKANELLDRDVPPPTATMPVIPDQGEGLESDWENIEAAEAVPEEGGLLMSNDSKGKDKGKDKGKGKAKSTSDGQEKSLPAIPRAFDFGSTSAWIPHNKPSTPAPIPIPEPHPNPFAFDLDEPRLPESFASGLRMPVPDVPPRQETPPPSFEDVYGPNANDVPPPDPTKKSQSLLDFSDDDGLGDNGDSGDSPENVDAHDSANNDDVVSNGPVANSTELVDRMVSDHGEDDGEDGDIPEADTADPAQLAEPENGDKIASLSPPVSPVPSSTPLPERLSKAQALREQAAALTQELQDLEEQRAKAEAKGDSELVVAKKVDIAEKRTELAKVQARAAKRAIKSE